MEEGLLNFNNPKTSKQALMKQLHPSHIFLFTALLLCIYIVVSHLD